MKQEHFALANEIFAYLGVQITVDGRRHLGAVLGTSSFAETYVRDKVQEWVGEVTRLSSNASSQLQAAYAALTRGLYTCSKWMFLMRTVQHTGHLFQPLEEAI